MTGGCSDGADHSQAREFECDVCAETLSTLYAWPKPEFTVSYCKSLLRGSRHQIPKRSRVPAFVEVRWNIKECGQFTDIWIQQGPQAAISSYTARFPAHENRKSSFLPRIMFFQILRLLGLRLCYRSALQNKGHRGVDCQSMLS